MTTPNQPTNILLTGGAGFIGSNLTEHLLTNTNHNIIVLDALTYAGNMANLSNVKNNPRFTFIHGNICNEELVQSIFKTHDIRGVFHLAAESHVDNSIKNPKTFLETNIMGTFTLIHAAYTHWMNGPNDTKEGYQNCRFHHTSTDEVYGTLGDTGLFTEETPYAPNPPYAASKAGSDFIVRSYHRTFGLNTTITNCSNNYGKHQHPEKLIPTVIRKALAHQPIPIFGDGKNIRDWLHVTDHCIALTQVFNTGKAGETYNIGCDNEQDNNTIVKLICTLLNALKPLENGTYEQFITYVTDRAGHDRRYAIDSAKIKRELNWQHKSDFTTELKNTINWYIQEFDNQDAA